MPFFDVNGTPRTKANGTPWSQLLHLRRANSEGTKRYFVTVWAQSVTNT
jgi:hypothetical protein